MRARFSDQVEPDGQWGRVEDVRLGRLLPAGVGAAEPVQDVVQFLDNLACALGLQGRSLVGGLVADEVDEPRLGVDARAHDGAQVGVVDHPARAGLGGGRQARVMGEGPAERQLHRLARQDRRRLRLRHGQPLCRTRRGVDGGEVGFEVGEVAGGHGDVPGSELSGEGAGLEGGEKKIHFAKM